MCFYRSALLYDQRLRLICRLMLLLWRVRSVKLYCDLDHWAINFLYCSLQRTKHCYGGFNRMSVNQKQSICRSKSTNQHTPSKYMQPVPVKSGKNSLEQVTIRLSFVIGWNVGVRFFSANHKLYQWMKSQASLSTFTLITPYSTRLLRWEPFKFWACYQCYKHVLLENAILDMSFHN